MSPVCDQDVVVISPELNLIFNKSFEKRYLLSFFMPFIQTYGGKLEIAEAIDKAFSTETAFNEKYFAGNDVELRGIERRRSMVREFLADFDKLSHTDIHILKKMTPHEALGAHTGDKFIINQIGGKPIKMEA